MSVAQVSDTKGTSTASDIPRDVLKGEVPVYITKSNYFRVIHVDGVFGGGTPTRGNIMLTVFSHRVAFPESIVNDFTGNEVFEKRVAKPGIEQEYEASLVMNLDTAKSLLLWLDRTIKNVEGPLAKHE